MVLGTFQYRNILLIWNMAAQGPIVLAISSDEGYSLAFFLPLSGRRLDKD